MPDKFKEEAVIVLQEEIAKDIFSMWLQTEQITEHTKAGQFISLYTKDGSKLLPRPISICELNQEKKELRLVYRVTDSKAGTAQFAKLKKGDAITVLGPLGNGFPKIEKKALLIGGGIGIPPMLELAKNLQCEKQIIVGYQDTTFLLEDLKKHGTLYVATQDGSMGTRGNVIDAIKVNGLEAQVIYACGPTPMLQAVKKYALEHKIECYLSLEEKMACGIGACLACVCNTKEKEEHSNVHNTRICKEGPVFLSTEVEI